MSFISRGFRGRPRDQTVGDRLPPGQYLVKDFPVLSAGPTPHTPLAQWTFSIIGEIDKGADFAELAKEHSTDPGGKSGGDLGYFGHDDMVKEFADATFALPPGQYTKAPVKTEFGWHVIKVEDHRVSTPPSFEEARQEVGQLVAHDIVDAKLKELRGAAKVETYGLDGKPLPTTK